MKMKHLLSMFAVAFVAVVMLSCSSGGGEVPITLSQAAVQLSAAGGTQRVTVTADPGWTATSSASWCSVTVNAKELVITAKKNYSAKARSAQVTISSVSGAQSQILGVTQKAGTGTFDGFTVSSVAFSDLDPDSRDQVDVNSLKNDYTLQVTTLNPTYSWRVEVDSDWVTTSVKGTQRGSNYFTFTVAANTDIKERTAELHIISEYEGAVDDYELTIVQASSHRNEDPTIGKEIEW
jgi:hypothetical protein